MQNCSCFANNNIRHIIAFLSEAAKNIAPQNICIKMQPRKLIACHYIKQDTSVNSIQQHFDSPNTRFCCIWCAVHRVA